MPDITPSVDSPLEHVYQTSAYLAAEGRYDLALDLVRQALVSARLERVVEPAAADDRSADIEKRLEAQYIAYRLKYEDVRKPWMQTLARTTIVSGIAAATFMACFAFAMYRLDALIASPVDKVTAVLDLAVKSELPKITNQVLEVVPQVSAQVDKQMQNMSLRFSDYLETKVDAALDARIAAIVDERLKARLNAQK